MPELTNTGQPLTATPARPGPDGSGRVGHPLVGVVGGMGPLASTEMLRTVYRACAGRPEQTAPRIVLWSDPAVIDRTEAIDSGRLTPLREALRRAVRGLLEAGSERVVIACVTAHHVLADLPAELSERCVSMVDVIHTELIRARGRHLMLCTDGTASSGVLGRGRDAARAAGHFTMLDPPDQHGLHREVYRLKQGDDPLRTVDFLRDVLARYPVTGLVAACTELHLVTRAIETHDGIGELPFIDPLTVLAHRIVDGAL